MVDKRLLQGMQNAVAGKTLDCDYVLVRDFTERGLAGADGLPSSNDGAGTTKALAAAIFRSREREIGSQDPKQTALIVRIEQDRFSVQVECNRALHEMPH